ncbi:hypothetical protein B0H13DRAFT_1740923 [Mycena leptocephala]|nr:hypothetical protein B0H13DRAFT_1740923 [Mycena leptocephala]
MNGTAAGMENTPSSFQDATCGFRSESSSYCDQMIRQGRGVPLYIPEPPETLPDEYRRNGVAIGDVGIVTPVGVFDFFFNIYEDADHPINDDFVPDDFSPLKRYVRRDIIPSNEAPGKYVSTSSVQKLEPEPQLDKFPGGHFVFSCDAPQGAVLALPHGAHLEKLENLETLRKYVAKHAKSWYKYIRYTRGRVGLENGSLYLVTGWEKAPSWGMASFHSAGEEFQLTFKPTAMADTTSTAQVDSTSTAGSDSISAATAHGANPASATTNRADSPTAGSDSTSTATIDPTSYQYRWSGVYGRKNPAQTKHHNLSSTNAGPLNQTTFIHGLSISVGTGIWAALFGKVEICEIIKFHSGSGSGSSISHNNGSSSSSSSLGRISGGGGGTTNGRTHNVGESGHVVLSDLSPISQV